MLQVFQKLLLHLEQIGKCSITYVEHNLTSTVEKLFLQLNYFSQYFSSRLLPWVAKAIFS